MRIDGSIPLHIARAYGIPPARQAAEPKPPVEPPSLNQAQDAYQPSNASGVSRLVAGRVSQATEFDVGSISRTTPSGSFQLYTRAADRIEAAVGVQIGRSIDVRA